ncbi:hypothetical protein [Nocardia sp. CS682]|uniref:hypothetical protein n=1 Tax=Nocardia sp. CS682 TaxID=1047172 RepID=UPI0010753491|nr:hypothetical protein [Nocardia sp. CS682]
MTIDDAAFTPRRRLLRIAVGVGMAAVAAPLMIENAAPASATQRLWKRCARCRGLWFSGNGTRGGCPAGDIFDGGHHDDGTGDYILKEDPDGGQGQSQWFWCRNCQGLWFLGNSGFGVCPSPHLRPGHNNIGSGIYRLEDVTHRDGPGGEDKWRWCRKCSGLFYDGYSPAASGVCPADKRHHDIVGSGSYVLRDAESTRLPRPPY